MADNPDASKRPLPAGVLKLKARKRLKLERNVPDVQVSHLETNRKVSLDTLEWTSVEPPEHLDDYEGFFGLEEIDNVQITRNDNGAVTFHLNSGEHPANSFVDKAECPSQTSDDKDHADDDEWLGFAEEANEEKRTKSDAKELASSSKLKIQNKADSHHPHKKRAPNEDISRLPFSTLAERPIATEVDVSAWNPMQLTDTSLSALSSLGFSTPTAIQEAAIPLIMKGHDVIGKAPTGSGKTLAFGLPVFEQWLKLHHRPSQSRSPPKAHASHPIALIVLPTRELAHQISKHLLRLAESSSTENFRVAVLTGGLAIQKQRRLLKHADVIVSTPGRLWEILEANNSFLKSLRRIQFLIIDEADRLLGAGQFKELQLILDAIERKEVPEVTEDTKPIIEPWAIRQTLVFSATFSKALQQKLAKRQNIKNDPLTSNADGLSHLLQRLNFQTEQPSFVDVNPISQMANNLQEGIIECPQSTEKDLYLYTLLLLYYSKVRTLVFVNSVAAVRRLVPFLQNLNITALGLHSHMAQKARLRSVERFSTTLDGRVLIATDVAARGLDIPNIEVVIHYHLPRAADTYVHRSGRTARASQKGSSILLCASDEVAGVRRLIARVHAQNTISKQNQRKNSFYMQSLDVPRNIVARLKDRTAIAKKLTDAQMAKEKKRSEDDWLRKGAEELGVDYSSEEFDKVGNRAGRGRHGSGRKMREKEARTLTKSELQALRVELKHLLSERLNTGISARYLTSNHELDIHALLIEQGDKNLLGCVPTLGFRE